MKKLPIGIQTFSENYLDKLIRALDRADYVFEFKLDGTKEQALEQMKANDYAQKYQGKTQQIVLVGVEFDKKTRNIGNRIIESLVMVSRINLDNLTC